MIQITCSYVAGPAAVRPQGSASDGCSAVEVEVGGDTDDGPVVDGVRSLARARVVPFPEEHATTTPAITTSPIAVRHPATVLHPTGQPALIFRALRPSLAAGMSNPIAACVPVREPADL